MKLLEELDENLKTLEVVLTNPIAFSLITFLRGKRLGAAKAYY